MDKLTRELTEILRETAMGGNIDKAGAEIAEAAGLDLRPEEAQKLNTILFDLEHARLRWNEIETRLPYYLNQVLEVLCLRDLVAVA